MASRVGDSRIIGVGGTEFSFERTEPDKEGRKIGDRKLVALWLSPLPASDGTVATATVNEFDDGILYGPSSIPGCFSDFAGAAAAEVTVRWLELANTKLASKIKRQRDMAMVIAGAFCAIAVVAISFR